MLSGAEDKRSFLALFTAAFVGVAACLYATRRGVGLFTDSKAYLGGAESLFKGHGYVLDHPTGGTYPVTNWPPLFSIALAGLGLAGIDLRAAARWLNVGLFGATIVLAGLAIRRVSSGSTWAVVFGALLMTASVDLLKTYSQAASDPLFIFFALLGLVLLGRYQEKPGSRRLIGAAAAVGLAWLSRYAGVVLVTTGALALLCFGHSGRRTRVKATLVFTALSSLPMTLFILRNSLLFREPLGESRTFSFHPPTHHQVKLGIDTLWGWLVPDRALPGSAAALVGNVPDLRWIVLSAVLVGGGGAIVIWRMRHQVNASSGWQLMARSLLEPPLLALLLIYVFLYLGFLIVSVSFFDADIDLGPRILCPALVASLIVGVGLGYRALGRFREAPFIRGTAMAAGVLLTASYAHASVVWLERSHEEGLGYAARVWQESDILQKVEALPLGTLIYSNGAEPLTLVTGRPAEDVPYKQDPNLARPNTHYAARLDTVRQQLHAGGVLVYLNRAAWPGCPCASEAELKDALHLELREAGADGSIYAAVP
jgi:hypothetical protein